MAQRSGYEKAYQRFNMALWRRIISHHHRWRRVEKLYNAVNTCSRRWMYVWEAVLAFLFIWWATMRWSWDNLKNKLNSSFYFIFLCYEKVFIVDWCLGPSFNYLLAMISSSFCLSSRAYLLFLNVVIWTKSMDFYICNYVYLVVPYFIFVCMF